MSDYDTDILDWSTRQAALLRRAAAGERVGGLDWPHIIEEVESVGRSQLSAVRSFITLALLHDLKAAAWPEAREVAHWRAEAVGFRQQAAEAFAPSMRQHIDMAALYRQAVRRLPASHDGAPADACAVTLDEVLAED